MFVLQRLKEPSTWAGMSMLLLAFGVPAGLAESLVQTGAALGGLAAVLLPERSTNR
jgi:hypothetical protein